MTGQAKRVLILEDEFLVAMLLEDLLLEMGHQVVGSLAQVGEAMTFADQADIDLAILDINLAGTKSFPVAEILRRRGIPFVFATGYGSDGLTGDFENELTLQKPYDPDELMRTIEEASARADTGNTSNPRAVHRLTATAGQLPGQSPARGNSLAIVTWWWMRPSKYRDSTASVAARDSARAGLARAASTAAMSR